MPKPIILLLLLTTSVSAMDDAEAAAEKKQAEALSTAVALNYCRAAFHRIRKEPTELVMKQEEEKILNNLNLTNVEDKEVVSLYSSVLEEISQMQFSDNEHDLYTQHHKATIRRQVTWDALAFTTELATAQFGSAIKTGANSWWDYRNKAFQRDVDLFKIEKGKMAGVLKRSNQLLDTFWDMARKKEIPDRWLVRGDDLDELEEAVAESDLETRLRILNRMKPYMEAYPPFWYYLSRTQQELGHYTDAVETYSYLDKIGQGHFRKDDMLATAMANQAAIYDYLDDVRAIASAEKALHYSPDVWEANLIAARVLQRHGKVAMAEDAILRNLDVGLEDSNSNVFLASLYFYTGDKQKLAKVLNDPKAVAHLPAPVLLRCAALVGAEKTPEYVKQNLHASLAAYPQNKFGRDELVVRVGWAWQLHLASFEVVQDGKELGEPQVQTGRGYYDLHFAQGVNWGSPIGGNRPVPEVALAMTYPDKTVVTVQLRGGTATVGRSPIALSTPTAMKIASVKIGDQSIALNSKDKDAVQSSEPVNIKVSKPISPPPTISRPTETKVAKPDVVNVKSTIVELLKETID